jgi:hypothetical protein
MNLNFCVKWLRQIASGANHRESRIADFELARPRARDSITSTITKLR